MEKTYEQAIHHGRKPEAAQALRAVISAYDKAAKTGVIHHATADRKKSRLAVRVSALK